MFIIPFIFFGILTVPASDATFAATTSTVSADQSHPLFSSEDRTVHLVWGLWDDISLPKVWARNRQRWEELNPTWKTRLWLRQDCEALANSSSVWRELYFLPTIRPIQRADLVRLMIVQRHGGLYADLDVTPKRSIEDGFTAMGFLSPQTCARYTAVLFVETNLPAWYSVETSHWPIRRGRGGEARVRVANFLFWARPGLPLLDRALAIAKERLLDANLVTEKHYHDADGEYAVIYSSGPDVISEAASRSSNGVSESIERAVNEGVLLVPMREFTPFASHGHAGSWEGAGNPATEKVGDEAGGSDMVGHHVQRNKRDDASRAPLTEDANKDGHAIDEIRGGTWAAKRFVLRLGRFTVKVDSLEELLDTFTSSLHIEAPDGSFYHYLRAALLKLREAKNVGDDVTDFVNGEEALVVAAYEQLGTYDVDGGACRAYHELGRALKSLLLPSAALRALERSMQEMTAAKLAGHVDLKADVEGLWYDTAQTLLLLLQSDDDLTPAPTQLNVMNRAVDAYKKAILHAENNHRGDTSTEKRIHVYRQSLAVAQKLRQRLLPS